MKQITISIFSENLLTGSDIKYGLEAHFNMPNIGITEWNDKEEPPYLKKQIIDLQSQLAKAKDTIHRRNAYVRDLQAEIKIFQDFIDEHNLFMKFSMWEQNRDINTKIKETSKNLTKATLYKYLPKTVDPNSPYGDNEANR